MLIYKSKFYVQDGSSAQGKFAGIGPESVACMAEQAGHEVNAEAITTLAEDVTYKLRQAISVSILYILYCSIAFKLSNLVIIVCIASL